MALPYVIYICVNRVKMIAYQHVTRRVRPLFIISLSLSLSLSFSLFSLKFFIIIIIIIIITTIIIIAASDTRVAGTSLCGLKNNYSYFNPNLVSLVEATTECKTQMFFYYN